MKISTAPERLAGRQWQKRFRRTFVVTGAGVLFLASSCDSGNSGSEPAPPNVLMILVDDIGIDQWQAFGYGGAVPPRTPNLDAIAEAGVRFQETWSMPTCSAGRAAMFTGRYPQNNGVVAAILPATDLAVSQVSPYEMTLPRVLATAGYSSGMFGKYHLGSGPNNPAGNGAPLELGWDRFFGVLVDIDAADSTAGGVGGPQDYPYGLVDDAAFGACFDLDSGSCEDLGVAGGPKGTAVGRLCATRGDVLVPGTTCSDSPISAADLGRDAQGTFINNGYYVWPSVDLDIRNVPLTGSESAAERAAMFRATVPVDADAMTRSRGYTETTFVDAAITWIQERQEGGQPWFAVYSTTTVHTPYQPPPPSLAPEWDVTCPNDDCSDPSYLPGTRETADAMIEAMDIEVGRLLNETGLARRTASGGLRLTPDADNTMVLLVADNGTYASIVKAPFDPTRAKGTVYQTGVWVPLTVAGPMVAAARRGSVNDTVQVNAVDVFSLIAEAAGVDYEALLPAGVDLDARPMLGLLTGVSSAGSSDSPASPDRVFNFSESGVSAKDTTAAAGLNACYVPGGNACTDQFFYLQSLCEANEGIWYGPPDNPDEPTGNAVYPTCCAFRNAVAAAEQPDGSAGFALPDGTLIAAEDFSILESYARAIRDQDYKLVALDKPDCSVDDGTTFRAMEFYAIDNRMALPQLDRSGSNLLSASEGTAGCDDAALDPAQASACSVLQTNLTQIIDSRDFLPGDGNLDGVVDQRDWDAAAEYIRVFGPSQSTVFDFVGAPNCDPLTAVCADGNTDEDDLDFIRQRIS